MFSFLLVCIQQMSVFGYVHFLFGIYIQNGYYFNSYGAKWPYMSRIQTIHCGTRASSDALEIHPIRPWWRGKSEVRVIFHWILTMDHVQHARRHVNHYPILIY